MDAKAQIIDPQSHADIQLSEAEDEDEDVFFHAMPTLLAQISRDLRYVKVNKGYAEFFGRTPEEIKDCYVSEVMGDAMTEVKGYLEKALSGSHERYQFLAPHKSGTDRWLDVRYIPKETRDGQVDGVYVLVSDVHELVKSQEDIIKKNEELSRLNTDLLEFSYSVSHDLKSPLLSITDLLELIEDDIEQGHFEDLPTVVNKVRASAAQLVGRVESMLMLVKSDGDKVGIESVHIGEMIENIVQSLSQDNIQCSTVVEHVDPVNTIPVRLASIMENLAANAVKFSDPEKAEHTVDIRTYEEDNIVYVTVEDNGIGIPEGMQHRVFRMFQRFRDHPNSGSGMGLAIAKRNALRIGGDINFQSTPEITQFTVSVPRMELE